jgi:hypothetical protein
MVLTAIAMRRDDSRNKFLKASKIAIDPQREQKE